MKELLNRLIAYETISSKEAKQILIDISAGKYNQNQIASFLTVFMMRSITLEEITGFRDALLELCIPIDLSDYNCIDLCGTGGDGKNTFNISTISAFVTAGAGFQVAKHGNYGVSSSYGSSNVLEHLGIQFTNDERLLQQAIEVASICILHAPLFHPAMKNVAPIRKDLGIKTFFNMLGPMVNPSRPKHQVVGVFNLELLRIYHYLYQNSDVNYSIIYDLNGYDEISLTNETKIMSKNQEMIFTPKDFDLELIDPNTIYGGDSVESSAKIFMNILEGNGTKEQNQVVCANAGLAISNIAKCSFPDGFEQAKESIHSGRAMNSFQKLIKLNLN